MRDHECEGEAQHREVEEASLPSTSLDHWEAQSVDVHKTAFPVYEDDDDRGLSRTFRISIIFGSILMMVAVILCLVVILPHSSKGHSKRLLEVLSNGSMDVPPNGATKMNVKDTKVCYDEIRLACRATCSPEVCESTLNVNSLPLRELGSQGVIQRAIQVASHGESQSHRIAQNLLSVSATCNITIRRAARNCEHLLRRASMWFNRCQRTPLKTSVGIKAIYTWIKAALMDEIYCHSALLNLQNSITLPYVKHMIQQTEYVITLTSNVVNMLDAYRTYGEDLSTWRALNKRITSLPDGSNLHSKLRITNRRLFGTPMKGSAVMSKDEQENLTSVQVNVNATQKALGQNFVMYITPVTYNNKTERFPYNKILTFPGVWMKKTTIQSDRAVTAYDNATVAIDGDRFIVRVKLNVTRLDMHQAVRHLSTFCNGTSIRHQDRLHAHPLCQFRRHCKLAKIEAEFSLSGNVCTTIFQKFRIGPG